jgi:hypothetical protein
MPITHVSPEMLRSRVEVSNVQLLRGMERLAVSVIAQAFADLANNEVRSTKWREDERRACRVSALNFLTGKRHSDAYWLAWWCDHVGLEPDYVTQLAQRIKHDANLAAEVRTRISYLGPTAKAGSLASASSEVGAVEGEEEEAFSTERSEEERDAAWHSTILTYISKRGTGGSMPSLSEPPSESPNSSPIGGLPEKKL